MSKLEQCTFVAHAVGFEKNQPFTISSYPRILQHNIANGIIAPGLFGVGITYPNKVQDPLGNIEYNVGVWQFVKHLENVFTYLVTILRINRKEDIRRLQ